MSIFREEFEKIKKALIPYSSLKERKRIAEEMKVSESSLSKIRDGRLANPSLQVLDSMHGFFFPQAESDKSNDLIKK